MSIKLSNVTAESTTTLSTPASLDRRLCDAALAAYRSIPCQDWKGRHPFPGGEVVFADAEQARAYLAAGKHALEVNGDPNGAIVLLDASIRLDQASVLTDGDSLANRVLAFQAIGNEAPYHSLLLYDLGLKFARLEQWHEAGAAYRASAILDPGFVWPLNNFAWMAATATEPRAHDGGLAVALAERACLLSQWSCGCFLGTLAAAYARAGDFGRAVEWQRITIELDDADGRDEEIARLDAFANGMAFVDHHPTPVGREFSKEELEEFDVETLRQQLLELTGRRLATLN